MGTGFEQAIHALLEVTRDFRQREISVGSSLAHQKKAVVQALGLMESHGGAIVADQLGLEKPSWHVGYKQHCDDFMQEIKGGVLRLEQP